MKINTTIHFHSKVDDQIGILWVDTKDEYMYHIVRKGKPDLRYGSIENLTYDWEEYGYYDEPIIQDEEIRKAVRQWWKIQKNPLKCAHLSLHSYYDIPNNKDSDGYYDYTLYGYVDDRYKNKTAIEFEFRTKLQIHLEGSIEDRSRDYTLIELCGEEDE